MSAPATTTTTSVAPSAVAPVASFHNLSRPALQKVAKENGVRSSGTNAEIIQRLEEKLGMPATVGKGKVAAPTTPTKGSKRKADPDTVPTTAAAAAAASSSSTSSTAIPTEEEPASKKLKGEDGQAQAATGKGPAKGSAAWKKAMAEKLAATAAAAGPVADDEDEEMKGDEDAVDLSGKSFVVMGGFNAGKFKIESTISACGGDIKTSIIKSLNYVVCGSPVATDYGGISGPGSKKYKEAKKAKITILNEDEFFKLVEQHKATKAKASGSSSGGDDTASSSSVNLGALWKDLCTMLGDPMQPPASEAAINALETEMAVAIPEYLKSLWRVSNGPGSNSRLHPHYPAELFPSVEDMAATWKHKSWNFGDFTQMFFRELRWIPLMPVQESEGEGWICLDYKSGLLTHLEWDCDGSYCNIVCEHLESLILTYHDLIKAKYDALGAKIDATHTRAQLEEEERAAKTANMPTWQQANYHPYKVDHDELEKALDAAGMRLGSRTGQRSVMATNEHAGRLRWCLPSVDSKLWSLVNKYYKKAEKAGEH